MQKFTYEISISRPCLEIRKITVELEGHDQWEEARRIRDFWAKHPGLIEAEDTETTRQDWGPQGVLRRGAPCKKCGGTGEWIEGSGRTCFDCNGKGMKQSSEDFAEPVKED